MSGVVKIWVRDQVGDSRSVADLFSYRHEVGLDVASQALHGVRQGRKFTMEALHLAARLCPSEGPDLAHPLLDHLSLPSHVRCEQRSW